MSTAAADATVEGATAAAVNTSSGVVSWADDGTTDGGATTALTDTAVEGGTTRATDATAASHSSLSSAGYRPLSQLRSSSEVVLNAIRITARKPHVP